MGYQMMLRDNLTIGVIWWTQGVTASSVRANKYTKFAHIDGYNAKYFSIFAAKKGVLGRGFREIVSSTTDPVTAPLRANFHILTYVE
jgi:hypothetical protein